MDVVRILSPVMHFIGRVINNYPITFNNYPIRCNNAGSVHVRYYVSQELSDSYEKREASDIRGTGFSQITYPFGYIRY